MWTINESLLTSRFLNMSTFPDLTISFGNLFLAFIGKEIVPIIAFLNDLASELLPFPTQRLYWPLLVMLVYILSDPRTNLSIWIKSPFCLPNSKQVRPGFRNGFRTKCLKLVLVLRCIFSSVFILDFGYGL